MKQVGNVHGQNWMRFPFRTALWIERTVRDRDRVLALIITVLFIFITLSFAQIRIRFLQYGLLYRWNSTVSQGFAIDLEAITITLILSGNSVLMMPNLHCYIPLLFTFVEFLGSV